MTLEEAAALCLTPGGDRATGGSGGVMQIGGPGVSTVRARGGRGVLPLDQACDGVSEYNLRIVCGESLRAGRQTPRASCPLVFGCHLYPSVFVIC